jgi:hypothetical protein
MGGPLVPGARGIEVARLQADLVRLGFDVPPAEVRLQSYGRATREAVARLQRERGIEATGVADAATLAAAADPGPPPLDAERQGPFVEPAETRPVAPAAPPPGVRLLLAGRVRGAPGPPEGGGLRVEAIAATLRGETTLGSAPVVDGRYEIAVAGGPPGGPAERTAVALRVVDAGGQVVHATGIRSLEAGVVAWDVTLAGAPAYGRSEWEHLAGVLEPLLAGVAPADLRQTADRDDLALLAAQASADRQALAAWSTAHRLAAHVAAGGTPVPVEVLWALLRQGQPVPLRAGLVRRVHAGDDGAEAVVERLMRRVVAMHPSAQRAALERAVADNRIDAGTSVDAAVDALRALRVRVVADTPIGSGAHSATLREVLERTPAARDATPAIVEALGDSPIGPAAAFDRLVAEGRIAADIRDELRQTHQLAILTRGHRPLLDELDGRARGGGIASPRELAKLSRDDWRALLGRRGPAGDRIGAPPNVDGDSDDEREELYAVILDRAFERAYPTTSFAAKLGRSRPEALTESVDVAAFLDAHPGFDLARTRVDHFLAERPAALREARDRASAVADLKRAQRLFKLAPTHDAVVDLLDRGFDSAARVAALDEHRFVELMRGSSVNAIDARAIHRRARSVSALALNLYADYNQAIDGLRPAALPEPVADAASASAVAALPSLRTLFGSLDACACEQCASITSPGAYLADVLGFLDERPTTGSPPGMSALRLLRFRRSDLDQVELSCANTHTQLPYIDLVNEQLEDLVREPSEVPLGLQPEDMGVGTVRPKVLEAMRRAGFPIGAEAQVLAPDRWGFWRLRDRGRVYLIGMGEDETPDGEVFPVLTARPSRQTTRTAAELRVLPEHRNDAAYDGLAGEVFPHDFPFDLWNLEAAAYLERLGVPQPRLLELFRQATLEPLFDAVVDVDGTAPPAPLVLRATPSDVELSCAHAGIAATGVPVLAGTSSHERWQLWGLFRLMPTGGTGTMPWSVALARVELLLERAELGLTELLQVLDMRFVDPAGALRVDPAPGADPATCDVADLRITGLTEDHLHRMQRFLRLWRRLGCRMWELDKALRLAGGADLARLLELERVRRRTGLDWSSVIALHRDIEHEPYVDRGDGARPVQTLYERLFRSPLSDPATHLPEDPARIEGTVATHTPAILAALGIDDASLRAMLADARIDPAEALTLRTLSRLYRVGALARATGLSVQDLVTLNRLWEGDAFAGPAATLGFLDLVERVTASPFSVEELDYVLAHRARPGGGVAIDDATIAALLAGLRSGFEVADRDAGGQDDGASPAAAAPGRSPAAVADLIPQKVAQALGLDAPSAATLLAEVPLPGSAANLADALNDPRLAGPAPAGVGTAGIDEETFPDAYGAVRLLHRCAVLIRRLGLSAEDVAWWLAEGHAAALGWLHPRDLPVDAGPAASLARLEALERFATFRRRLPRSNLTALGFVERLLDPATTDDDVVAALAELTASDAGDLRTLLEAFGWFVVPSDTGVVPEGSERGGARLNLLGSRNQLRLLDCLDALRVLGVDAERAVSCATPRPRAAHADSLRQALRAKLDATQWHAVMQPLQDGFRERRRDALVRHLVAFPFFGEPWDDWDAAGISAFLLMDVEMDACMLTSRLQQAIASTQLYAQRCLLGLEQDVVTNDAFDPKWRQWEWMRRYRLWEANRQVFLYPENWLAPELRREKSPIFVQLERDLMQGELTAETAERAYRSYLERLRAVGNLEVRALASATDDDGQAVLHVIGRGRARRGGRHFHRRQIAGARWTPWEPVELDIDADHLVAAVSGDRRLQLMWPHFIDKADPPGQLETPAASSSTPVVPADKHWEVRVHWSERRTGAWTPKVLAQPVAVVFGSEVSATGLADVQLRQLPYTWLTATDVHVGVFVSAYPDDRAPQSYEFFWKRGPHVAVSPNHAFSGSDAFAIKAPADSRYANDLVLHTTSALFFGFELTVPDENSIDGYTSATAAVSFPVLHNIRPGSTFTVLRSDATHPGEGPDHVFVWDDARTYHVTYWCRFADPSSAAPPNSSRPAAPMPELCGFTFAIHYHPFIEQFVAALDAGGVKALLNRSTQLRTGSFDFAAYVPAATVTRPPVEDVDFSYAGAYSAYNWELFFHVPMLIANRLAAEGRHEEALTWYRTVFDPTGRDVPAVDPDRPNLRFWVTKPFYETTTAEYREQRIAAVLAAVAQGDAEVVQQVEEWRANPFDPHLVARLRTVAYQKYVVVQYVQTLIAWGDRLFREDTLESLTEATQLYEMAASLLGPRPRTAPHREPAAPPTYAQLAGQGTTLLSGALVEVENLLAPTAPGRRLAADVADAPRLAVDAFCIPPNEQLLGVWDRVEDRLFKIRHCLDIEGRARELPLFEPAIDPGVIARARAAGADVATALADPPAPLPSHRFTFMLARAREVCSQARALGAALLSALEKRDAEGLALLRSGHELAALAQLRAVRSRQVEEAASARAALAESRKLTDARLAHYRGLITAGLNRHERSALDQTGDAADLQSAATVLDVIGGALALVPDIDIGIAGFGGSPTVKARFGGSNVFHAVGQASAALKSLVSVAQIGAGQASTLGSFARRTEDWALQVQLAEHELAQIDRQIATADLRHAIVSQELANHDRQAERAAAQDEFLRSRFTGEELIGWTIGQLSTLHLQTYGLAYDLAKRAERCYRHELGLDDSNEVRFGAWDSMRQGLLAGERLALDLDRMEASFHERNERRYELTKHVSLAQLDPVALLRLRQNGRCVLRIPETAFDLDYPGHYFRRLREVKVSIPCVVGPYTTVACTLTLTANEWRRDPTVSAGQPYARTGPDDRRFSGLPGHARSIATSSGQRDDGLFALELRDERYLPFEGAGAVSTWEVRLNEDLPPFDFSTISDFILHVDYTAREGGEPLRAKAVEEIERALAALPLADERRGLFRVFDVKREFPDQWYRFNRVPPPGEDQELVLDGLADRLPYFTRRFGAITARRVELAAGVRAGEAGTGLEARLSAPGAAPGDTLTLADDGAYEGLLHGGRADSAPLGTWTLKLRRPGAPDFASLPPDVLDELFVIVNYELSGRADPG